MSPRIPASTGWRFGDVQLEMSLKPFVDLEASTRKRVLLELFEQWRPLWRHAESVSVMLWVGDGSEILSYEGDPDRTFEWGKWHGSANRHHWNELDTRKKESRDPDHQGTGSNTGQYDPEGKGIHSRSYPYRENPAAFTYRWLGDLVSDIKNIGAEITGRAVYVGETFDIGPEFAVSKFKYELHREILGDGPIFKEQFITCEAVLHADALPYAGFPDGIPEGTPIGTFLGKQLACLFKDVGFDFLWLSNGFGFSLEPWAMVGEVFDGTAYHPDRSDGIRERILRFWKDLRREFPLRYPIRTRGTNMATGIDIGSDASPLRELYAGGFGLDAPINSPWAALDGDFGLELSGWMSHIARLPHPGFRFRFYIHDPWWVNSPWLDRYGRQPHDLYLPLSVSRLTEDGEVEIPSDLAFLSVDDSHGHMPPQVPNEVIAHLLAARETAPDAPGPLLWVYPFDDMHERHPGEALHADAFIGAAINQGAPLNTVCDIRTQFGRTNERETVWVSPVPPSGSESEQRLYSEMKNGGRVLLFGPIPEGSAFANVLGIQLEEELEGDFEMPDGRVLRHTAILSGGAFRETGGEGAGRVFARQKHARRCVRAVAPGLAWTRASLSTAEYDPDDPRPVRGPILRPLSQDTFYPPGQLMVDALEYFGWRIQAETDAADPRTPVITVHRHRNAFLLNGYFRNERAKLRLRMPQGAPLPPGRWTPYQDGCSELTGQTALRHEVRVFVIEGDDSVLRCKEVPVVMHGINRRLMVEGGRNTQLLVFPDPDHLEKLRVLRDPHFPYFTGESPDIDLQYTPAGLCFKVEAVNGNLLIEW